MEENKRMNPNTTYRVVLDNGQIKDYSQEEYDKKDVAQFLYDNANGKYSVFKMENTDISNPDAFADDGEYRISVSTPDGRTAEKLYSGKNIREKNLINDFFEKNYPGQYTVQTIKGFRDAFEAREGVKPILGDDRLAYDMDIAKQNLDAFEAENGSTIGDYDEALYEYTTKFRGATVTGDYSRVGDEPVKPDELLAERKRLRAEYLSNPLYRKQQDAFADYSTEMAEYYKEKENNANNKADHDNYNYARKFDLDAARLAKLEVGDTNDSKIDKTFWKNMGTGAADTFTDRDFWTLGITEIARNNGVTKVIDKINDSGLDLSNASEHDLDNLLTESEKALLGSFLRYSTEMAERSGFMPKGYSAGQTSAEAIGFMAQFFATGGAGSAIAKGAIKSVAKGTAKGFTKAIAKYATGEMASDVVKGATRLVAGSGKMNKGAKAFVKGTDIAFRHGVTPVVNAALRTPFMTNTYVAASEDLLNRAMSGEDVHSVGLGMLESALNVLPDQLIENWSEGFGETISAAGHAIGGAVGKKLGAATLGKLSFEQMGKAIGDTWFHKVAVQAGFNGLAGEMLEEWAGNAARVVFHTKDSNGNVFTAEDFAQFADPHQQLEMAISFAPLSILGLGGSVKAVAAQKRQFDTYSQKLRGVLERNGMTEDEIANIMDTHHSRREITDALAPVLEKITTSESGTQEDYETVLKFASVAGAQEVLDAAISAQQEHAREGERKVIASQLGAQNENDAKGRFSYQIDMENGHGISVVTTVTDASGNAYYYIGTQGSQVMLKSQADGSITFMDKSQYDGKVGSGELKAKTQSESSYLDERIESHKADKEAMQVEQFARDAKSKIARHYQQAGNEINIGTEEAPLNGRITNYANDGIIVEFSSPVEYNGSTKKIHKIGYDQAGQIAGIDTTFVTEQERVDNEIDAEERDRTTIKNYNGQFKDLAFVYNGTNARYQRMTGVPFTDENGNEMVKIVAEIGGNSMEITVPLSTLTDRLTETQKAALDNQQKEDGEAATEGADQGTPKDFRGNPIPMKVDAEGNQTVDVDKFFKSDPESYLRWNDSRRGRADSQQIVRGTLAERYKAREVLMSSLQGVTVPSERDAIHAQIDAIDAEIKAFEAIQHKYDAEDDYPVLTAQFKADLAELIKRLGKNGVDTEDYIIARNRLVIRFLMETRDSASAIKLAEQCRQMQAELDKIEGKDIPVVVATYADIMDKMKAAGCTEGQMTDVMNQISAVIQDNMLNDHHNCMNGFHINGRVFIFAEGQAVRSVVSTYYHERQHMINASGATNAKAEVSSVCNNSADVLKDALLRLIGPNAIRFYESLDVDALADEVLAFTLQEAYTNPNYKESLKQKGLSDELINVIDKEYGRQNGRTAESNVPAESEHTDGNDNTDEQEHAEANGATSEGESSDGQSGSIQSGDAQSKPTTGAGVERLSKNQAEDIISQMEESAEVAPSMELTTENWLSQFGEDGKVTTPIGEVKMGENQYFKIAKQGRDGKLGMVKPTLEHPFVIIEDVRTEIGAERETSYLFIRTFVKNNGERFYYFTSVTVSKEGHEVVISNQEKSKNRISKLLQNGKIAWIDSKFSLHPKTQDEESVPLDDSNRLTLTDNQSALLGINSSEPSASEDKQSFEENKTSEVESSYEQMTWSADSDIEKMKAREAYLEKTLGYGTDEYKAAYPEAEQFMEDSEELAKLQNAEGVSAEEKAKAVNEFRAKYKDYLERTGKIHEELSNLRESIIAAESKPKDEAKMAEKEKAAEERKNRYHGYLQGKPSLATASIEKALEQHFDFIQEGGSMTVAEFIEKHLADGDLSVDMKDIQNYPARWNKMDDVEQKNWLKTHKPKTEYLVNGVFLNKSAYDYAQWLLKKNHILDVQNSRVETTDSQGNPLNTDGSLKVDMISSIDELTDEDFTNPTRNVQLPELPKNVDGAIGADGKPVVIKKNIFEKNRDSHQFTSEQSRDILDNALYKTDLVGKSNPSNKQNYWVAIKVDEDSLIVVLEVSHNKDNVEIVSWYSMDERNLARIKRQAERNGGELIILSRDKVESLSTPAQSLSSDGKSTQSSGTKQEVSEKPLKFRERTPEEKWADALREQGTIEGKMPKITKPNLYEFVATESDGRSVLRGVYHDEGFEVASNGHILVAVRSQYDASLEGKVTNDKGEEIQGNYPKWRTVLEQEVIPLNIDIKNLAAFIQGAKAKAKEQRRNFIISFRDDNGNIISFDGGLLEEFINFALYHKCNLGIAKGLLVQLYATNTDGSARVTLVSRLHVGNYIYDEYQKDLEETKVAIAKLDNDGNNDEGLSSDESIKRHNESRREIGRVYREYREKHGDIEGLNKYRTDAKAIYDKEYSAIMENFAEHEAEAKKQLKEVGTDLLRKNIEYWQDAKSVDDFVDEKIGEYLTGHFYKPNIDQALTSSIIGDIARMNARKDFMLERAERELKRREAGSVKKTAKKRQAPKYSITANEDEIRSIIDNAKRDGTYMKAPNGKPTNLNERQWVQVRTKAFKNWFGDWEKAARIEKLRKNKSIENHYNGDYELSRNSAKQWLLDNIRGEYSNKDTGETITVSKVGINEVTAHGSTAIEHLKSLHSIPEMIEDSVFIDEISNTKGNDKYDSYRYYVCGLKIDDVDYTAKIVVGVKDGNKYYDHRLTEIEKGVLTDRLNGLSNSVAEKQNTLSIGKDSKLLSILQNNSSKVVDENGEPRVVIHTTPENFTVFKKGERAGLSGKGIYFAVSGQGVPVYGRNTIKAFLNVRNPLTRELIETDKYKSINDGGRSAIEPDIYDKYSEFDGVMVRRDEITVKNPNQIKSATDNVGSFDENNQDIRYSIDERDAEYFKAIEEDDLERARQLVNDAAEAAGYNVNSDYQGTSAFNGAAPWGNSYFLTKEERREAWYNDEFDGEQTLGDYIDRGIDAMNFEFIVLDPRSYRFADANRKEAITNVRNIIQSKGKTITMYRSVPADVKEGSFRNGDWVTPSRGYAEENARIHGWGDNYNIIEQKVSTDDVWWDGNDIAEWGYGRENDYINDTDFAYKNTKNNRKSLDVITYDKNGRIIPLSERFNENSSDVNYSVTEQSPIQGLENYTRSELTGIVGDYTEDKLAEQGIDAEILGVELHGSRNRGDARVGSDLDAVVEYRGDLSEDSMFNILNDEDDSRLYIEGIPVDINPIREGESGTLDEYMQRSTKYDEEKLVQERQLAYDTAVEMLNRAGVPVEEMSGDALSQLEESTEGVQLMTKINSLTKAANAIRGWLANNMRGKSFTIELPEQTQRMIRKEMGRDFDTHLITADGIAHAKKNHGENGQKLTGNSIPLRDEDFALAPYIMTNPDYVRKGSTKNNRESVRFYKTLKNGYVVVVEKEWDNSADDLETINMWAELSDVFNVKKTLNRTSETPTISRSDVAKIIKDAENAIASDNEMQLMTVYHGSGAKFDKFDSAFMGTGEGAQAYGWGHYVTEVESIGKIYADASTMITGGSSLFERVIAYIKKRMRAGSSFEDARNTIVGKLENLFGRNAEKAKYASTGETIERLKNLSESDIPQSVLYTIDIPEDTGENYLSYDGRLSEDVVSPIADKLSKIGWKREDDGHLIRFKKGDNVITLNSMATGADLYAELQEALGSDKAASEFLGSIGYTGIKYPTNFRSGGNAEGTNNYVIFNDSDLKITDRIEFLRDGAVVYGAAVGGKIYLNSDRLNPNTPIHEYTHLWDKACKATNPELWKRGVELMKQLPIWDEVANDANYKGLDEDGIASEVHSRLSGDKGEALLTKMSADILAQKGGSMMEKAQKLSVIELVKDWAKDFWSWLKDTMTPWSREEAQRVSLDEFIAMPVASLAQSQKEESDAQEAEEQGVRYSIVDNAEEIARLENEPTIKTYRAMQLRDGKLYPPMAGKVNGKWQQGIAVDDLGKVWEKSDEHPELVDDKGYFTLNKGNGKSLKARYNPYIHTSLTPLNDQFSEAQDRPELVTVEVEVPERELTSGYKADKAKDSVGRLEWKAGVIQSKLSGTRTVILSRWDKPVRIVPESEVADVIVGMFDGKDITMPSNVVTPALREELEKRGVPFVETDNQGRPVEQSEDIEKVNVKFNEQLGTLTEENADRIILSLGSPSDILLSAGVEDKPMKLYGNKVMQKMRKHGFALEELRDLPSEVANPIAVFNNYGKDGNRSILTELHTIKGNFLVAISLGKGTEDIDFNIVSSVFGKGEDNIVDWLNRGLATYIDKEKALNYLHHSALHAVTSDNPRLSSATKIVNDFVNPTIQEDVFDMFTENLPNYSISDKSDWKNDYVNAMNMFLHKDKKDARRDLDNMLNSAKDEARILYKNVLDGNFNSVTLQQINDYIDNATNFNRFYRPLSQRLPERALLSLSGRGRAGEVDALFSRICESSIPANGRTRAEARRRIEAKKEECLEGWAKAAGFWHESVADFTSNAEPIGHGTDSVVYMSDDGATVIKVSKGKFDNRKFPTDIDQVPLFNMVFPRSAYRILGYGRVDGQFVKYLEQPYIDFATTTPLSVDERVQYMHKLGFEPYNEEKTMFSNGEIVVSDLQKANIVRDAADNVRVIDADVKLHTKDIGGNYTYPPVEADITKTDGITEVHLPNYSISETKMFAEDEIAQMETPILESKGTFRNLDEAEKWAKENLQGKSAVNEFTGERISIGRKSVEKMLSEKAQDQSVSISAHIAALQSVLDFIRTGIPAEIHKDNEGRGFNVMRLYNAIVINGELYRVKSTVRKVAQGDKYYTYEVQEMEMIEERRANRKSEEQGSVTTNSSINSISGKDLLWNRFASGSTPFSMAQSNVPLSDANVENNSEKTNFSITERFEQADRYVDLMSGKAETINSEKMTDALLGAYLSLPENVRQEVIRLAPSKRYNFADAFAQYLANRIEEEDGFTEDDWKAIVANRDALKDVYGLEDLSLYDALWMTVQKAYPGRDIISRAHRVTLANDLGMNVESEDMKQIARHGVNFSISENMKSSSAAEMYARAAGYFKNRLKEGFVDMNESINDLVEAIEIATGEKAESWEDIRYALNQQSSKGLACMEQYTRRYLQPLFDALADITNNSKLSYEEVSRYVILKHAIERNEIFARRDAKRHYQEAYNAVVAPLNKEKGMLQADRKVALSKADMQKVSDIDRRIKDIDKSLNDAQVDLAVHMNNINKGNDAIYLQNRETDYGGLTSMFSDYPGLQPRSKYRTEEEYNRAARRVRKPKYQSVADMENAAQAEIDAFEKEMGRGRVSDLWKKINDATKETLRSQYEANMLSKAQYDAVKAQFKYYVPLRGFSDTTAEDVWSYYTSSRSDSFAPALVSAKGRKSEAENPFNWIGTMASSAIAANTKNETKLALYYFIANRPGQDLVSMGKSWYRYDAQATSDYQAMHPGSTKRFYSEVFPPSTSGLNAKDAQDTYRKWEEDLMRDHNNGLAYQSSQKMDVSDDVAFISNREQPEHVIRCKVAGEEVVMTINSNPRAAQAVNGLLNIEAEKDYQAIFGKILRFMSSVNTSYNPEFWISNAMRDILFATMSTSVNGNGVKGFVRHLLSPRRLMRMAQDFREGTLGNSYIETMFREFAENGAITGYTVINNNEYWEKQIQSTIHPTVLDKVKAGKFLSTFQDLGEAVEQMTRFAAYVNARENGKDITEAVSVAKEITVNFNRKGSGKTISKDELRKLTRKDGTHLSATEVEVWHLVSMLPAAGRRLVMFFNAGVQGLNAMYKLQKANGRKFNTWMAGYFIGGALQAILHALFDDDDEQYLDLSDYVRRNNALIGLNGIYLKWALPQEARVFYAWGDMFVSHLLGREPHKNLVEEMSASINDMLPMPLIPVGVSLRDYIPSALQPITDIAMNKNFMGSSIYNDMRFLSEEERSRTPRYANAKKGTGAIYVDASKILNYISGGDEYDSGKINIAPEVMEHVVNSIGGGLLTTVNKGINTVGAAVDVAAKAVSDKEIIGQDFEVRNVPFLSRLVVVNDDNARNAHISETFYWYKSEATHAKSVANKMKKNKDRERLREYKKCRSYRIYEIYSDYKKADDRYNEQIKAETDRTTKDRLIREQDALRRRMIREISELDD